MSLCVASDPEQFHADLRAQSANDVWIEKIKISPVRLAEFEEPPLSEDAASELRTVLDELRSQPDDAPARSGAAD